MIQQFTTSRVGFGTRGYFFHSAGYGASTVSDTDAPGGTKESAFACRAMQSAKKGNIEP